MRYFFQFLLILAISFVGEAIHWVVPLPIPASIYGMVILFVGLMTGVVKLHHVRETGLFLVDIMPILFIPAGVGLMAAWDVLSPVLLSVAVITVVSLLTVMAVTGRVAQAFIGGTRDE